MSLEIVNWVMTHVTSVKFVVLINGGASKNVKVPMGYVKGVQYHLFVYVGD